MNGWCRRKRSTHPVSLSSSKQRTVFWQASRAGKIPAAGTTRMAKPTGSGICLTSLKTASPKISFSCGWTGVYGARKRALLEAQDALVAHLQGISRSPDDGHGSGGGKAGKKDSWHLPTPPRMISNDGKQAHDSLFRPGRSRFLPLSSSKSLSESTKHPLSFPSPIPRKLSTRS